MLEKNVKKTAMAMLCVMTMSTVSPVAPIVYGESVTVNGVKQGQEQQVQQEQTNTTFKERLALEREQAEQVKVSTIPAGYAYIPENTILNIELTEEISSKKAHKGDRVPLTLQENVIVNDVIVIPAGTTVEGYVTEARSSGKFGRSGKLEFSINSVKSLNGVSIPLEYTIKKQAGDDGGAVAVAAAVTLVGGFFMKGKNVNFPAGSVFEARVTSDTSLNVPLEKLEDAMNPDKPHGVSITIK